MLIPRRQAFTTAMVSFLADPTLALAVPFDRTCTVVGVGVLGTELCRQILEASPTTKLIGITATTRNHDKIREQVGGSIDETRFLLTISEAPTTEKTNDVVFCAPPSGFDDYPAAVQSAIDKYWLGPESGGTFVFTSSGAVYVCSHNIAKSHTYFVADV